MTYLDIFRLGYILSHRISWKIVFIDPSLTIAPILYPLKTSGNHKSSGFFRGYKMRTMAKNGIIKLIISK